MSQLEVSGTAISFPAVSADSDAGVDLLASSDFEVIARPPAGDDVLSTPGGLTFDTAPGAAIWIQWTPSSGGNLSTLSQVFRFVEDGGLNGNSDEAQGNPMQFVGSSP